MQSVLTMYASLLRVLPLLFIGTVVSWEDNVDLLNTCLDGMYHKIKPGPEDLHLQCEPWSKRSCCTNSTTVAAHYGKLYNFDQDHCRHVKPLSLECKNHFRQDLCFYECSPNVGPWLAKVEQKIRKQKYFEVPLCASDCDAWFDACQNDYTCTDNWARNFDWLPEGNGKKKTNMCPEGSSCKTFKEIYLSADNFCERVWDHSWKYTPDNQHCMRLWFDGASGNPNDAVANWKVTEMRKNRDTSSDSSLDRSDGLGGNSDDSVSKWKDNKIPPLQNVTSSTSKIQLTSLSLLVTLGYIFKSC